VSRARWKNALIGEYLDFQGFSSNHIRAVESLHLSFIDLERVGFGEILPEVMIFPEGLCPEGNINTEGLRVIFRRIPQAEGL
jgi:hypothetical protein